VTRCNNSRDRGHITASVLVVDADADQVTLREGEPLTEIGEERNVTEGAGR
jgi:hypothetical protein